MKISIAMTTYNGEKYIIEQLDSLKNQTLKPDEVIIADDGSSDNTCNLIKCYIEKFKLVNWFFYQNEKNMGWKVNFHNVIKKTTGDVVFFCDQDDVWYLKKIETMTTIFRDNPTINVLACKSKFIDSYGNKLIISKLVLPFGREIGRASCRERV